MINFEREVPIVCHKEADTRGWPVEWRIRGKDKYMAAAQPFRTCSYCGSMHPLDLLVYLVKGAADLHGADWKYGWPHKFYCDVPNPDEGASVVVGTEYKGSEGTTIDLFGSASAFLHAKFYNVHLLDVEEEEFEALVHSLHEYTGITFVRGLGSAKGELYYSAPAPGYQAWGRQAEFFQKHIDAGLPVEEALLAAVRDLKQAMVRAVQ